MPQKERDYRNLKETEKLYDAVKRVSTQVKDYSLTHTVSVSWGDNDIKRRRRLVEIRIGEKRWLGVTTDILDAINWLVGKADDNGWLPREKLTILGMDRDPLEMDTTGLNQEALRDHLAVVSVSGVSAIIDLEELLKATRYS